MSAVKETLCTKCIHRHVCINLNAYLSVVKECNDIYEKCRYDWLRPIEPICINFSESTTVLRSVMDGIIEVNF